MDETGLSLPAGRGVPCATPLPWSRGLPKAPDPEAAVGWMLGVLALAVLPAGTRIRGEQEGEGSG